jgi:hypothetical protein
VPTPLKHLPPGVPTKTGPSAEGVDEGGILWIPAWAWALSVTWQEEGEFEFEVERTKDDPRMQAIVLGEYLLTHSPHEDTELACAAWIAKVRGLARE